MDIESPPSSPIKVATVQVVLDPIQSSAARDLMSDFPIQLSQPSLTSSHLRLPISPITSILVLPGPRPLPPAPPLTASDNPLHLSDLVDNPPVTEDVDMTLETEIEEYMTFLAEEQEASHVAYCAIVSQALPPVTVIELPSSPDPPVLSATQSQIPIGDLGDTAPTLMMPLPSSATIQLEPASITMALLGVTSPSRNRIAFIDKSDEEIPIELTEGPSTHKEEAFEDAQNLQFSPVQVEHKKDHPASSNSLLPRANSFDMAPPSGRQHRSMPSPSPQITPLPISRAKARDNARAYQALRQKIADRSISSLPPSPSAPMPSDLGNSFCGNLDDLRPECQGGNTSP